MTNLEFLLLVIAIAIGWAAWRRRAIRDSRWEAIGFVGLCCLVLLLALRFGARTYPGIYYPDSELLNGLFNGSWLFVEIGYDAALGAFAIALVLTFAPVRGVWRVVLRSLFWLLVALAAVISFYGFYWAVVLDRTA